MESSTTNQTSAQKELVFQLVLHAIVFHFVIIDHEKGEMVYELEWYQLLFFANYTFGNVIISYVLLPRFLYKKKYLPFAIYFGIVVFAVILMEEFVLEKLIFPDTRGALFRGVMLNLGEVLSVLGVLVGVKFAWDSVLRQREIDTLKIMVNESELSFLNSQINPHFLFNNLNNLYSYAVDQSPKTPEIILGLSGVLRYMLYECRESFVPLSMEVNHLRNFINLYEMQIEDRGEVTFVTEDLHESYAIAPLILSVFVENAFKHSQSGQSDRIQIHIRLSVGPVGELTFSCLNNYEANETTLESNKGIGLENVRKRLALLYPGRHTLVISNTDTEFSVLLKIQLERV